MREEGWEVFGIEISKFISDFALKTFKLENIFHGTLKEASFKENSFDLITFWDVIEHLPNPIMELKMAYNLLKRNGILILETQNINSLFAKIAGRKWHHYKFWEHLYHFSPETIEILIGKAGFEIIQITPFRVGKYVSIDFIIERMERYSKLLYRLISPLKGINKSVYINPFDEIVVCAIKKKRV